MSRGKIDPPGKEAYSQPQGELALQAVGVACMGNAVSNVQ